jgi:flagellar export protein FliJ
VATFKFRLAPVLRYRERIKEEKQWELRALNEARRKMEEEICLLEQELHDSEEAVVGEEGRIYSVNELRLYGDHVSRLCGWIREKHRVLEAFDQKLDEKRGELVEALRAVKTLEQLFKRLEAKFHREQEIEERKLADETSQRRFIYRMGGGQKLP